MTIAEQPYKPRNMRVKNFIKRKMIYAVFQIVKGNGSLALEKGNMWVDQKVDLIFRAEDDLSKIECVSEWGIWQGILEKKPRGEEIAITVKEVIPIDDDAVACQDTMLTPEQRWGEVEK